MFWIGDKVKDIASRLNLEEKAAGALEIGGALSGKSDILKTILVLSGTSLPLTTEELAERLKDTRFLTFIRNYLSEDIRKKILEYSSPFASLLFGKEGVSLLRSILGIEETKRDLSNIKKLLSSFIGLFTYLFEKITNIINSTWQTVKDLAGTARRALFEYSPLKLLQVIDPGVFSPLLEPVIERLKDQMIEFVKNAWSIMANKTKQAFSKIFSWSKGIFGFIFRKKEKEPQSLLDHPLFKKILPNLALVEGIAKFFGFGGIASKGAILLGGTALLIKNSPFAQTIKSTIREIINPVIKVVKQIADKLGIQSTVIDNLYKAYVEDTNLISRFTSKFEESARVIKEKLIKREREKGKDKKERRQTILTGIAKLVPGLIGLPFNLLSLKGFSGLSFFDFSKVPAVKGGNFIFRIFNKLRLNKLVQKYPKLGRALNVITSIIKGPATILNKIINAFSFITPLMRGLSRGFSFIGRFILPFFRILGSIGRIAFFILRFIPGPISIALTVGYGIVSLLDAFNIDLKEKLKTVWNWISSLFDKVVDTVKKILKMLGLIDDENRDMSQKIIQKRTQIIQNQEAKNKLGPPVLIFGNKPINLETPTMTLDQVFKSQISSEPYTPTYTQQISQTYTPTISSTSLTEQRSKLYSNYTRTTQQAKTVATEILKDVEDDRAKLIEEFKQAYNKGTITGAMQSQVSTQPQPQIIPVEQQNDYLYNVLMSMLQEADYIPAIAVISYDI